MMRTYNLLIFMFVTFQLEALQAQDSIWNKHQAFLLNPHRTEFSGEYFEVNTGFWGEANASGTDFFLRGFLRTGLSPSFLEKVSDRHRPKNLIGSELSYTMRYTNFDQKVLKRDSLHWFVEYGFREHTGATFSEDLFRLVMTGNKAFEGKSANGNGAEIRRIRYDYLQAGLIKRLNNQSMLIVSAGPARGMRLIDLNADRLSLYTAPYGTHLELDIDGSLGLSGTWQTSGLNHVNGMGFTFSTAYAGKIAGGGSIQVGLENAGLIWFRQDVYSKTDSLYFDGWNVGNLNSFSRGAAVGQAFDSIVSAIEPAQQRVSKSQGLPARIYASYQFELKPNRYLSFQFDKVLNMPMLPRFAVTHTAFWKNWFWASEVALGGYSRLGLNQHLGYSQGRNYWHLRVYALEGVVMPFVASGVGGAVGYAVRF